MNQKAEELKAPTRKFALDVLALVKTFPNSAEADVVRRQLVKAATGMAANYRSTCRSRSHTEFVARIGIVLEESDESEFWIGVVRDSRLSTSGDVPRLCDESAQLQAIFARSNLTARGK